MNTSGTAASIGAQVIRHNANAGNASCTPCIRYNKNQHAVALGHMTSAAKAEAAKKNGKKGGNPADF